MPSRRTAISIIAASLIAATATYALAQTGKGSTMTSTTSAEEIAFPLNDHLPTGYREARRRSATVDGETAELVRYERVDGRNAGFGGEHFSTLTASNGRLKGFARIDLDLVGHDLPSREEAQAVAMDFLQKQAPDLLPGMKLSWIDPHDEPLRVIRDGRTENLTLKGMKVKMRNTADGRWFWVIVGADRKVMVFERDIHWITFPGHRGTEKWLHDSWLVEGGHSLNAA
ncbi:hypothetical protein [Paenochrobactrum glaciei]|uniref:Uncharacterized protein n=1 Tax=Paenochrobactrum glaciei TaxID=486407 RepID=A0ABP3RN14_9HYPH